MSFERDLPIKPFEKCGIVHTVVRVSLDYSKDVKGPVVHLQTGTTSADGPFNVFRMAIMGSPSTRVVMERGWKMNNKKRMEAAAAQLEAELFGKRGDTWAAVEKLLTEAGSELAPVAESGTVAA